MNFISKISITELGKIIDAKIIGNTALYIKGLNEIHKVKQGDIVFVDNKKYYDKALNSKASAIIINDEAVNVPKGKAILFSKHPFNDFNKLIKHFNKTYLSDRNIGENCSINKSSFLHPSVVIGNNVKIGESCVLHPNVVIYNNVTIGNNVTIHSGCIIGANAYYYKKQKGAYSPLISCGNVIIENNVDIGANTTIDIGVTSSTIIKSGTKIDNQVQIGHDTVIGNNCLLASQVGVAGCVTIEDDVILWGQVGVASDITIKKGTIVYAQSGLTKGTKEGKTYFGSPALEARDKFKEMALIRKIPDLIHNKPIEEKIEQEKAKKELEVAAEMQKLLFPSDFPNDSKVEVAAHYETQQLVGGDYYDFIKINNEEYVFCIADVSGKGIPAALLMSNFQANLRANIKFNKEMSLTELIEKLNDDVNKAAKNKKHITFFIAYYNAINKELKYINAGHNHPLLLNKTQTKLLDKGCVGLGLFDKLPEIEVGVESIQTKDILVCYTDGIVELENEKNEQFEIDNLLKIINKNFNQPVEKLNMSIFKELNNFKKSREFLDDTALLSCRFIKDEENIHQEQITFSKDL